MRPEIVIISDDEHKYDSQDTGDWYRTAAGGFRSAKSATAAATS